ncbi:6213_t:CDS:2 [Funneliformis mosseae]|uniref:6213_t:CDS:1 n=1 Tax=Funneliformis mosseae TaxID=27381 RepID=A0A9N9DC74_FUNMO|nr:6213_t:CDS:2 [Funneliformis mosseae]
MSFTKSKNDKKSKVEKGKTPYLPIKKQHNDKLTTDKNHEIIVEKSKNEIDDIFATVKSKKVSTNFQPQKSQEPTSPTVSSSSSSSMNKKKVDEFIFKVPAIPSKSQCTKRKLKLNDDDGFSDSRGTKNRRITEDGLPIFDIKELNIGRGEDTQLCPFDCNCCE